MKQLSRRQINRKVEKKHTYNMNPNLVENSTPGGSGVAHVGKQAAALVKDPEAFIKIMSKPIIYGGHK